MTLTLKLQQNNEKQLAYSRLKKKKQQPRKQNSNMALQESLDTATVKLIQDTENSFNQTNYEEPLN